MRRIIFFAMVFFTISCSNMASHNPNEHFCQEPRPKACTREYRPVCTLSEDGSLKTYSNACTACADLKVKSYFVKGCKIK